MRAVKQILDKALATTCVLLFAVLVITVSWQVFARQVLQDPSGWSEELARYVFVWLGMFGAALVFSERGHIAVDFVVRRFAEPAKVATAAFVQVVIIVFAVLALILGGIGISRLTWDQSLTALPISLGLCYSVMPITGAIITFYAFDHLLRILRQDETTTPDPADTTEAL